MTRRPRKSTLFPNPTLFRSRREMPTYLKEYSACPEVFQEALDALINRRSPLGGGTFGGVGPDGYGLGTDFANPTPRDRKSTRLKSSHANISFAVFCLKKKTN